MFVIRPWRLLFSETQSWHGQSNVVLIATMIVDADVDIKAVCCVTYISKRRATAFLDFPRGKYRNRDESAKNAENLNRGCLCCLALLGLCLAFARIGRRVWGEDGWSELFALSDAPLHQPLSSLVIQLDACH